MINEQEMYDFLELINFTLSDKFTTKWEYKYNAKFIEIFKFRILKALHENKPIKLKNLYNIYYVKHKYSKEQILNFFKSIEIDLYFPLVIGDISSL